MSDKYDYLNLLERKLDPHQKEVCCRTENTIVAAGAGSGKTQVLATRFAWLVMSCRIPASKILTLTFTKKAAGEMYKRIYETLLFFAENQATPEEEKKLARRALNDFSNVHIQTLDSYCKSIVEEAATGYGIRPDFTVGSSDSESDIKNQALPFVFSKRNSPAVKNYSSIGNYQAFADQILARTIIDNTSIATSETFFTDKLSAQKKEIIRAWNYLIFARGDCPDIFKEMLEESLAAFPAANCAVNALSLFENEFNETKGKTGTPYHSKCEKIMEKVAGLEKEGLFLDESFDFENFRDKKHDQIYNFFEIISLFNFDQRLSGYTNPLRECVKPLKNVFYPYLEAIVSYIRNYSAIKNLQELLDEFKNQINAEKRRSGKLTFKDVSELSLEILVKNKALRRQEKNSYDKIMIDEFQDNNGKNRDLLFLLSEKEFENEECGCKDGVPAVENIRPDKLFFVGDEKQSIYKFRGAEVSVFNELKKDLGEKNFLQMVYNYRSDSDLITSFNRLFGKNDFIFDSATEKNFEARYEKEAVKFDPKNKAVIPEEKLSLQNVRLHACLLNQKLLNDDSYLDENNQTAYFIAKKISRMMQEVQKDGKRPRFSDFAILEKSRHRNQLLRWLNYFGIPYQLDANTDLFSDGPINDIYAFLRLCVYPSDKNAFAIFLASPFCNLNQKSLESILAVKSLEDLPEEKDQIEKESHILLAESSEKQRERFTRGITFIKSEWKNILSQPLAKTVSTLWYESGYHYATMENHKTELYAEQFDFLFELARQCDQNQKSISWFVDQLAIVKNKEKNTQDEEEIDIAEVSYPLERQDAVQIMTIHKSKGLQFKYVFITGCISAKDKNSTARVFFDEEYGASVKPESSGGNFFSMIQKLNARRKNIAEFRRLIYVAITRAISEVFIVGKWSPVQKDNSRSSDDENFRLLEKCIKYFYPETKEDDNYGLEQEYFSGMDDCPFSFQSIKAETKKEAYKANIAGKKDFKTRIFDRLPSDTEEIPYEEVLSKRKTPSGLEKTFEADSYEKYDRESDSLEKADFSAADFGTLVHDYLRAQAEGIEAESYQPPVKLFKQLSPKDVEEKKTACIKMCRDFAESPLGCQAYSSDQSAKAQGRFLKAEWAFRMFHEDSIWTGSIDLIYENEDGSYTIVDYKSDAEIKPEIYEAQQMCYRTAASKLLQLPEEKISCKLWYLRHKKTVDL